jgi:4-hydroxy-3-polyprenylbenzoate decarboxylase
MTEAEIASAMEAFIEQQPRSWKEILTEFKGQNYRDVYRAFGALRPRLGRVVEPPYFPYTFSDEGDFVGKMDVAEPTKTDIRHHQH